jgi:hypothetical protein
MTSKALLRLGAILEAATGLALTFQPALVVQLLLGGELSSAGLALGRVAGFGLLSLGVACWPRAGPAPRAIHGLLVYNLLVTVYLAYLLLGGELVGRLLLPAVALHAVLALLFATSWLKERNA